MNKFEDIKKKISPETLSKMYSCVWLRWYK